MSGYIQSQFQYAQSAGAKSYDGGDFSQFSKSRFMLRRARVKIDYFVTTKDKFAKALFTFQVDATERGVNVRDMFIRLYETKRHNFSMTTGIFARPFGFEVNLSSAYRETPERGRMSQILMPTERDLGVMRRAFFPPWRLETGTKYVYQTGSTNNGDKVYVIDSSLANIGKIAPRQYYGADFQVKDRLFDSRPFSIYLPTDNPALRLLPESTVFSPENFGVNGEANKFGFDEIGSNKYRYLANSILNAGYLQFDNELGSKVRLVWGARVENFDQLIGSVKVSDDRHVRTKKTDVLPGINLTYKLDPKTNIRVSASQTIIRPEFRELAPFTFFDFELNAAVLGSPDLQRTKVTNADIRYELYPRSGETFSLGVFYKYFNNPIEQYFNQSGVATSTFNFLNAKQATSFGVEADFRKRLDVIDGLKNFTVQGNLSYIYNRVKDEEKTLDRPMQGQSPYVINVGVQYDLPKAGLNTTVLFNQIGRRILLVGNEQVPAIWENSRPLLDLQIAKKLMKDKGEIRLNIQDIMNKRAFFYHDINDDNKFTKANDAIAISRLYGTNISLTFGYTFK
ncbi:TonB-dependent receptor [Ostertagia ostertagi]